MLAFVEGSMEQQFVNQNFKYIRVVPVQNGITWTPERLCEQIVTSFRAFNFYGDTFVWLDREGREIEAEALRLKIRTSLVQAGADPTRLYVLVNDRMVENLILADEAIIREEFDKPHYTYTHEGQNGKRFLSEMCEESGVKYKEMVQGVRLLKRIRISNSAAVSPCAQRFFADYSGSCWWI